jgi:hypothetical protein
LKKSFFDNRGHFMGSTGSGSFTDYPGTTRVKDKKEQGTGGGDGGGSQPDRCDKAFSVSLEDIEHCDYFKQHKDVPKLNTQLRIAHKKRVVAETTSGETVGNIPTKLNYLAGCLKEGYTYIGTVRHSSNNASGAVVMADFAATSPK